MKEWTGAYVAHLCKKCGNIFIAEDYTRATTLPPKWRYCKECCKELGIKYEEQTPRKNRTPEEEKRMKEFAKYGENKRISKH